jgi:hypothetical protein
MAEREAARDPDEISQGSAELVKFNETEEAG